MASSFLYIGTISAGADCGMCNQLHPTELHQAAHMERFSYRTAGSVKVLSGRWVEGELEETDIEEANAGLIPGPELKLY